jgi:hypothetical protein
MIGRTAFKAPLEIPSRPENAGKAMVGRCACAVHTRAVALAALVASPSTLVVCSAIRQVAAVTGATHQELAARRARDPAAVVVAALALDVAQELQELGLLAEGGGSLGAHVLEAARAQLAAVVLLVVVAVPTCSRWPRT